MPPEDNLAVPFLTRKMLSFEGAVTFRLYVESYSAVASDIQIRGMTKEGPFTLHHAADGSRIQVEETFNIPDIPIFLSVTDTDWALDSGECYVSVRLQINNDPAYQICAGYVYQQISINYPMTQVIQPTDGLGKLTSITGANPAAGAQATVANLSRTDLELLGITVTLVTSAAAANRRVHFVFDPVVGPTFDIFSSVDQAASLTRKYTLLKSPGGGSFSDDNDIFIPLPEGIILANSSAITTSTTNMQAGDDFGAMAIWGKQHLITD